MPVNGDYSDDELLQLSGLQHFLFCRRQWALIHIENIWSENYRTMDGDVMHQRAHSEMLTEKRGDTVITRGMAVVSRSLGVSGQCDVVEFKKSEEGVSIFGWDEKWLPFPVEYKRGQPKDGNFDAAQLCCQAMCLEEMLLCRIPSGALYYCRRDTADSGLYIHNNKSCQAVSGTGRGGILHTRSADKAVRQDAYDCSYGGSAGGYCLRVYIFQSLSHGMAATGKLRRHTDSERQRRACRSRLPDVSAG